MIFRSRKLSIWLISLGMMVGIYLLYNHITGTADIDINVGTNLGEEIEDVNGQLGTIGGVEFDDLSKTTFVTRNEKTREIERILRFEKLLDKVGDEWEIAKPDIEIFNPDYKCHITADRGLVQIEGEGARVNPRDITLVGNVVIHVLPEAGSDGKESNVYLDDVVFVSDKSLFSTTGPVRFVSDDAQMSGRGMEIVYDSEIDRLEYVRIFHLDSLRFKSTPGKSLFAASEPGAEETIPADTTGPANTQSARQTQPVQQSQPLSATDRKESQQSKKVDNKYTCTFSKNVLVDTPEQLMYAYGKLVINDIFFSKAKGAESDKDQSAEGKDAGTDSRVAQRSIEPAKSEVDTSSPVETPAGEPSAELVETFVTCDDGILITLADSARGLEDTLDNSNVVSEKGRKKLDEAERKTTFAAMRIDYSSVTRNAVAIGPLELTYYPNDVNAAEPDEAVLPVTVTAREGAEFLDASNLAVFEGDCVCLMPQAGKPDSRLMAPKFIVKLPEDGSTRSSRFSEIEAVGPLELIFYSNAADGPDPNGPGVPVKVTAQERAVFSPKTNQAVFEGDCLCTMPQGDPNSQQQYTLISPMLVVNLPDDKSKRSSSADVFASGPAELTFYVDDLSRDKTAKQTVPAKVTAQNEVRFLSSANQVVFDGNCVATMLRQETNFQQKYTLSSRTLTIDLPGDDSERGSGPAGGISHLRAEGQGETVQLDSVRMADGQRIGFTKLKCIEFDYDNEQGCFLAANGLIAVDNSKIAESNEPAGKFSLQKRCYAVINDFDTLEYFFDSNEIVVDANANRINIDYFPIAGDQYGEQISVTAGHIVADLVETDTGRNELSTLTASTGISYEDKEKWFEGSELFFDANDSIVKVRGDETQACLLNGAVVDKIEYNLTTDHVHFEAVEPGALQARDKVGSR